MEPKTIRACAAWRQRLNCGRCPPQHSQFQTGMPRRARQASTGRREGERRAGVMPIIRRQRRPASASCARLQSRQFPAHAGDARADKGLVADEPQREADQDRREGREPRSLCRVSDGGGRHPSKRRPPTTRRRSGRRSALVKSPKRSQIGLDPPSIRRMSARVSMDSSSGKLQPTESGSNSHDCNIRLRQGYRGSAALAS